MATNYLGVLPDTSFGGTFAQSFTDSLEKQRQQKLAMAEDLIKSGAYQPTNTGPQQNFGQRLLGGIMGPNIGSPNMNIMGQNFQFQTPELKAAALQKQMQAYGSLLGGGNSASSPSNLERDMSVDPVTGDVKFNFKSKPQDQTLAGITDVSNKTPEQLREELKKTNPKYAALLESYASGRQSLGGRGAKQRQAIQQDLAMLYPGMTEGSLQARNQVRKDFTIGNAAKNIKSLNTAVGHLSEFKKLIPELHNGNWRLQNILGQWYARQTGGKPAANLSRFNAVKTALSGELATIYKNSAGTDVEIKNVMDTFNSADSPDALQAAADEIQSLMASRTSALQDQWHNAFNMPGDEDFPVLSGKSKQALKSMGYDNENNSIEDSGNTGNWNDKNASDLKSLKSRYGLND